MKFKEIPDPWTIYRESDISTDMDRFYGLNRQTGQRTNPCATYDMALNEIKSLVVRRP